MVRCQEDEDIIRIETPLIQTAIRTTGYVSGTMAGTCCDKRTGVTDPGFGLHIMDFLLAPGWRGDEYSKDRMHHGNLPKHTVEGPQICTRAGHLDYTIIRGARHIAVQQWFVFTEPGEGYQAGSRWKQTLLFLPDTRYFLSCETITSVNDVEDLFYRIDMPGHLKHDRRGPFQQIYLSYHGLINREAFRSDFPPDERFFYTRHDTMIPDRFIRAYLLTADRGPSTWLAGMTLDPAAPCEAWCHQRGYVCFIQENHRRPVGKGESFGAAYIVGYFDSIDEMNQTYDRYKGTKYIEVDAEHFTFLREIPQGTETRFGTCISQT